MTIFCPDFFTPEQCAQAQAQEAQRELDYANRTPKEKLRPWIEGAAELGLSSAVGYGAFRASGSKGVGWGVGIGFGVVYGLTFLFKRTPIQRVLDPFFEDK